MTVPISSTVVLDSLERTKRSSRLRGQLPYSDSSSELSHFRFSKTSSSSSCNRICLPNAQCIRNGLNKSKELLQNKSSMTTPSMLYDCSPTKHSMLLMRLFLATCLILTMIEYCHGAKTALPDLSKIPTPPRFTHEPNPPVIYFVVHNAVPKESGSVDLKTATLHCRAVGHPEVKYRWEKNGLRLEDVFDAGRMDSVPAEGTVVLKKLRAEDSGIYQCFAENGNGTAVDRPIELKQTYLGFFERTDPEVIEVELGQPFHRKCEAPTSEPEARVFWLLKNEGKERQQFVTVNSSHIAMNDKGEIFFSYVDESDSKHPELFYTCAAANSITKDYKFGKPFGITVAKNLRQKLDSQIPPQELYTNNDEDIVALRGGRVQLFCIFSGFPESIFTPEWRKIGGEIDWSRTIYETNWKKSILIDNVEFTDAGRYRCMFPENSQMDREFKVLVEAAPYWLEQPKSVNSSEGESVSFVCNAIGIPQPSFKFYKNGRPLQPDGRRVVVNRNTLTINDLRAPRGMYEEGDNAVYQCKAENKHGVVWANFYLNILSFQPIIEVAPSIEYGVTSHKVSLKCKVFGSPQPRVDWESDKLRLIPSSRWATTTQDDGWSVLTIDGLEGYEQGDYRCVARNKYGWADATGSITLRNATRIIRKPSSQTVIAGERVVFYCSAIHDPDLKLDISWNFEDTPVGNDRDQGFRIGKDSSLIIDSARKEHSGIYVCTAKTALDKREEEARLIVRDVPNPPFGVWAHCADRSAVVHWTFVDDQPDTAPVQEFVVQMNSGFEPDVWETYNFLPSYDHDQITVSLSPMGQYRFRIMARNEVGDSAPSEPSRSVCNTTAARPDVNPANVEVRGNSIDDMVIYWEPMPKKEWNGPGFHYEVRYRKESADPQSEESGWKTVKVTDPYADHVVIDEGIDGPFAKYEVQVKAVNEMGESAEAPKTYTGHSGEGVPIEAPTGFRFLSAHQPTAAIFEWNSVLPETVQGNFVGYKITHWYEDGRRSFAQKKEAFFDRRARSGTVYGLKPFRKNKAYIQVVNGAHTGPESETIEFVMPEGVASTVRFFHGFPINESSVGLVWNHPRESNGRMFGYYITWRRAHEADDEIYLTSHTYQYTLSDPTTTHFRVGFLLPDALYRFTIRALTQNGLGYGDPTSSDVRTLPLGVFRIEPEAPSVQLMGIGENELNVTWLPGKFSADENRPVGDKFYFKYKMKGASEWLIVYPEGDNFSVSIGNLYSGSTYEVKAISISNDKESESAVFEYTTAGTEPMGATAGWLVAIIVAIIILIIILIVVCLVVRNRGAKYPVTLIQTSVRTTAPPITEVHQKEKSQGREAMLQSEKGFGEYVKGQEDERRSLTGTGSIASETDSMMDYADGEAGKFTEDGSFIGAYGVQSARDRAFV